MWYQCNTVVKISIHALLAESDSACSRGCWLRCNFYPRSPCGERHPAPVPRRPDADISIHALLAESDNDIDGLHDVARPFLSTLSLRRATPRLSRVVPTPIFLSTLSLRRATITCCPPMPRVVFLSTLSLRRATNNVLSAYAACGISIHALLAESDSSRPILGKAARLISIHALLAESDRKPSQLQPQPTHFYPRSPCGERHCYIIFAQAVTNISIHALLAESDA